MGADLTDQMFSGAHMTDLLDRRCQEILAQELERLARRVPSLADDHLGAVEMSLRQIIDRLIPVRARTHACPEAIEVLFDLDGV